MSQLVFSICQYHQEVDSNNKRMYLSTEGRQEETEIETERKRGQETERHREKAFFYSSPMSFLKAATLKCGPD